ncbi:alpha-L-fucosidase [Pedobacter chinensis]|uniref:alpha-L-fucosidase n=1 Tax=Pedobacter chinensis TaxID=2282421 RepID=A0A369Q527_9SPHI|nr:alpha-L-fucosidase [Pedobacter chinensis]RDC58186.1 alpha-L-fucosidase [Pedobacter chinensis]
MKQRSLNLFKKLSLLSLLAIGLGGSSAIAQQTPAIDTIPLKYGSHRTGNRTDSVMQRWRSYALGQFIHWGVYAIPGGHWEDKSYNGAAEWIRSWSGNTAPNDWKNTYDNLYKQFNPTDFNAAKWAKQAKNMGAKYVIFTTKHHDGFCMWPSKYTDYTIKNTPYKKDIVKQVVDAYNAEGVDVYLYFSIIDWNHKGYRSGVPKTPADSVAYEDFKKFTRNQLIELLTKYPTAKGLWFDGTWDAAWVKQSKFADDLEKELRKLRPGLIIGSRFRADEYGKRHFDSNGKMMGDYEQGWERKLPASIDVVKGRDWDCVMTIPPNQWGYNSDWKSSYIKTANDLTNMLLHAVSMNGNLVVNFGPDGKGNIRTEEGQTAEKLGEWVKQNSEAIYGARYSGLPKPEYGYYTKKDNKLYLTVFNSPVNHILRLPIPRSYAQKPIKAILGNQQSLPLVVTDMGMSGDANLYYDITLPEGQNLNQPFVITIELNQSKGEGKSFGEAKT